jgi:hypothetical protein
MRALIIGVDERRTIADLKDKAAANIIDAALAMKDDPETARRRNQGQTILLPHGFSVTYTRETQPTGLCDHLAVSVDAPKKTPNPFAVDAILEAFGMRPLKDSLSVWPEALSQSLTAVNVLQAVLQ